MIEDSAKFLAQQELLSLHEGNYKVKLQLQELEIARLKQQVIQLKAKNFELISSLKQYEVKDASEKLDALKKKQKDYTNSLKERYSITSEAWGFNPETGEIIEE